MDLEQHCTFIEGAGHWIQQERPALVNQKLLAFLNQHRGLYAPGSAGSASSKL